MNDCLKKNVFGAFVFASIVFIIWMTTRYFPVEPDVANSPLVWREYATKGLSAIHELNPTIDNWYFTVYPLHFLVFSLLGGDGLIPLRITSALFCISIAIFGMLIVKRGFGYYSGIVALCLLTLMPAFGYTFGFMAHPFSHNSTNAFGIACLFILLINVNIKSFTLTLLVSVVSLLAAVSDPWYIASFFIPMFLSYSVLCVFDKKLILHSILLLIACVIALSNIVQFYLGIPPHVLTIVSISEMLVNIKWCIILIGKGLNLFIIDNDYTAIASFACWVLAMIFAAFVLLNKNNERRLLVLFSFLSIAGIISSFIITYQSPDYISARFFMNVTCFVLMMCGAAISSKFKYIFIFLALLFVASSLNSYKTHQAPLHNQSESVYNFIDFLNKNNLHYGYGSFWDKSVTVNWLSGGRIHITPVFFNPQNGFIDFKSVRQQTMASWHSDEAFKTAPERQFIVVNTAADGERCLEMDSCIEGIIKQVGAPDQILIYNDDRILVFDRRINI